MTILVTGSTGRLGAPTIAALFEAGIAVRGLTRRGPGGAIGDLSTGAGLEPAFARIDTVVHCAQSGGDKDLRIAANLIASARRAGVGHLVLVSIVDCDRIGIPYYRQRAEIERIVDRSGIPYTLQRATQFHELIAQVFDAQRRLPLGFVPRIVLQPVATEEVGQKLATLALGQPQGRVPDIGGPEALPLRTFFEQWKRAVGSRKPSVSVAVPGAVGRAYRDGAGLVPGPAFGVQSFAQFLAER